MRLVDTEKFRNVYGYEKSESSSAKLVLNYSGKLVHKTTITSPFHKKNNLTNFEI